MDGARGGDRLHQARVQQRGSEELAAGRPPTAPRRRRIEVESGVSDVAAQRREPVRVHSARRDGDHDVAGRYGGAVEDLAFDDADGGGGEVEAGHTVCS